MITRAPAPPTVDRGWFTTICSPKDYSRIAHMPQGNINNKRLCVKNCSLEFVAKPGSSAARSVSTNVSVIGSWSNWKARSHPHFCAPRHLLLLLLFPHRHNTPSCTVLCHMLPPPHLSAQPLPPPPTPIPHIHTYTNTLWVVIHHVGRVLCRLLRQCKRREAIAGSLSLAFRCVPVTYAFGC